MRSKTKIRTMRICTVLLLLMTAIVSMPQAIAKPQYAVAMNVVYGISSCTECHTDPNGGKSLTDYGSQFKSQSIYKTDSVAALRIIGAPGAVVVTVSPVATTVSPVATDVTPVVATPAVTMTVPVVTAVTPAATATESAVTAAPTSNKENPRELQEKEEERSEKEETSEKSPGIGIVATIGIIGILFVTRKYKIGKR